MAYLAKINELRCPKLQFNAWNTIRSRELDIFESLIVVPNYQVASHNGEMNHTSNSNFQYADDELYVGYATIVH